MEVLMPNELGTYYIFTDGACKGNPGPGGWAAIIRFEGLDTELKGYAADTTLILHNSSTLHLQALAE